MFSARVTEGQALMLQVVVATLRRLLSGRPDPMSNSNAPHDLEEADSTADMRGVLLIFGMLVLGAVYFISGWAPGI